MYGQIIRFAGPVIISQLGHVVMGMVDLYFLGQLNATYLAAGILATQIHFVALVFCIYRFVFFCAYAVNYPFGGACVFILTATPRCNNFGETVFVDLTMEPLSFNTIFFM